MKNKALSIFHAVIPYVKELRAMAGSMEGCILMQQLDYWFAIKPDGFFKFLEPVKVKGKDELGNHIPGHPLYRKGDSWCEELNCSPHEFRRMFDAIGTRWNSKSEYMNADDRFRGKGYCSFVDRKQNLTFYFRNHELVDAFLNRFVTEGAQNIATSGKRATDLGKSNPLTSEKAVSLKQRLPAEITPTTPEVVDYAKIKSKTPVWHEGELEAGLNDFVAAAFWWKAKVAVVNNPAGFKAKVRKRVAAEGPSEEDWETLMLWRASLVKPAPAEYPQEAKRTSELKQRLADAKLCYGAMGMERQLEVEARFVAHLSANNSFIFKSYCQLGLDSGVVARAFSEWFANHLE